MSLVQGPYPTAVPAGQHRPEDDKKREQSCSLVTKLGKEWGPKGGQVFIHTRNRLSLHNRTLQTGHKVTVTLHTPER